MACRNILVVEDDVGIRETIKDLLEMEGYRVLTAAHGEDALRLLKEIDRPCLIFLDLMMPVMDGWQFLYTLKNEHPHVLAAVPITVVSAVAEVGNVQQQYGCRVITKPVDIDRLVETAHEHCQHC